jgi:selenocysteine-specific elongation factor
VDVPGHERFVRNMLAGAHGIDGVVLVVAADESVMPQTREHFHICRLLGIPRGLVALTKCDIADADTQALTEMEVRELVAGSFLQGRPVLRLSSRTGDGLPELREALLALAREAPLRSSEGLLRLPIDRVFSLHGFGTVVTGTLVAGQITVGDEIEVLPSGRRARVRGLQVLGESVGRVSAGTRTAVNVGGLETAELVRGDVLTRPGSLRATSMLDVEVSLLPAVRPLVDGARVRVHVASAEVLARIRLLGEETLAPGASGLAQLRLESRTVAGRGDRLILRSYAPTETIAGALVIDPLPPRRRRRDRPVVERLRDARGVLAAAEAMVVEAGVRGIEAPVLAARLAVPLAGVVEALSGSATTLALGQGPVVLASREALDQLTRAALDELSLFHREQPLKPGMPREELRARVFGQAPPLTFERVVAELAGTGRARVGPDTVALATHTVTLSTDEAEAREILVGAAQAAGLAGVELPDLARRSGKEARLLERLGRVLVAERVLDRVGEGVLVHRRHLDALKEEVRRRWPPGSRLDVSAFKAYAGLSRKYVIPLLEYLDRERVTRRAGADRLVLG